MDDVRVVLQILIEINFHTVAVAREVVAGKVNQHNVLGILLGVVAQILGTLTVGLGIAGTFCGSGNRVDVSAERGCWVLGVGCWLNSAVCLW